MQTLVHLTRAPLGEALAELGAPWQVAPSAGRSEVGTAGSLAGRCDLAGSTGAWLDFWGIVRAEEDSSPILALEYEAHEEMARHQLEKILERLQGEHPLLAMLVVHRLGVVLVGEASLLVRIFSPHRGEALRACADFIDELKRWVPIWKHAVRG